MDFDLSRGLSRLHKLVAHFSSGFHQSDLVRRRALILDFSVFSLLSHDFMGDGQGSEILYAYLSGGIERDYILLGSVLDKDAFDLVSMRVGSPDQLFEVVISKPLSRLRRNGRIV